MSVPVFIRAVIAICIALTAVGCGEETRTPAFDDPAASSIPGTSVEPEPIETPVGPLTMSADAVGPARLGMTQPELVAALGSSFVLSEDTTTFEEGFGVRAVTLGGDDAFSVHFDADTSLLTAIVTTSPHVRTEQGLTPGMTIEDAADVLGTPAFTMYLFEGGRESVEFDTPVEQLVRPAGPDGRHTAGVYDYDVTVEDPIGPYTSATYSPGSVIFSLTIEG